MGRWLVIMGAVSGCDLVFPIDPQIDAAAASPGLVAHFAMDRREGIQVDDVSGNGHHAFCTTSCPDETDGTLGGALSFNGMDTMLLVSDAGEFNWPTEFTISMYVNAEDLSHDALSCLVSKAFQGGASSWMFCLKATGGLYFETTHEGSNDPMDLPDVVLTAWHHLAIRWDGLAKVVFVDGQDVGQSSVTTPIRYVDTSRVAIGAAGGFGTPVLYHLDGRLDDLRFYDRALSDDEIATLAVLP